MAFNSSPPCFLLHSSFPAQSGLGEAGHGQPDIHRLLPVLVSLVQSHRDASTRTATLARALHGASRDGRFLFFSFHSVCVLDIVTDSLAHPLPFRQKTSFRSWCGSAVCSRRGVTTTRLRGQRPRLPRRHTGARWPPRPCDARSLVMLLAVIPAGHPIFSPIPPPRSTSSPASLLIHIRQLGQVPQTPHVVSRRLAPHPHDRRVAKRPALISPCPFLLPGLPRPQTAIDDAAARRSAAAKL